MSGILSSPAFTCLGAACLHTSGDRALCPEVASTCQFLDSAFVCRDFSFSPPAHLCAEKKVGRGLNRHSEAGMEMRSLPVSHSVARLLGLAWHQPRALKGDALFTGSV